MVQHILPLLPYKEENTIVAIYWLSQRQSWVLNHRFLYNDDKASAHGSDFKADLGRMVGFLISLPDHDSLTGGGMMEKEHLDTCIPD